MNETVKQQKIARFLADEAMASIVKDVLLANYLKPAKDKDVQYLAASRIAIDLLQDGWRELERYRHVQEAPAARGGQSAL